MNRSKFSTNFLNLFNGETFDGWKMAGKGSFIILQRESALQTEEGMGLLWYYKKKFKDFTLELEWKASCKEDNSGVFIRFPNPRNDPYVAIKNGYEIQIDDLARPDSKLIHGTGAVYEFAAPSMINSKSIGEWNGFKIIAEKQKYTIMTNSVTVISNFTGNRSLEGYIGLQNHDDRSKVSFRNIRAREML
ncbi:MAG: 3-keto-disaccharide hydrolase [Nitrososphaeraceae archaeon]